jgi:hypothetical protein
LGWLGFLQYAPVGIRKKLQKPIRTTTTNPHPKSQISKDLPRLKSTFARASRPRRKLNLDVAHDLKPLRARVHSSTGMHEALNTTVFCQRRKWWIWGQTFVLGSRGS